MLKTLVLLPLLLLLGGTILAQTEILYLDSNGNPLPIESVNTCQDSSFINQVRIEITSDTVNELFVNIALPDGITYFPGSVNIVSEGGPSSPISVVDQGFIMGSQSFRIFPNDLDVGDFFILEWGRVGNCEAIASQQAGDFFKDEVALSWANSGSNSDTDQGVRSYDLLVGSLSLDGEGPIVTSLGSSVMRELTITNGGQGQLDEFTFYIIDGFGTMTTQLETDGGTVITSSSTSGDTLFYTLSTTEIAEFGNLDAHFDNGEQVVVKRTYTVTECDNYSGYGSFWGCEGSICQETTVLEQSTVIENLVPNIDVVQINLDEDYCYNGQNSTSGGSSVIQTFQMTNSGNGEARDLFMSLNSYQPGSNTGQNYFDVSDDWIIKDQNGNVLGNATHVNTLNTSARRDANCSNAQRPTSVRYELGGIMIPAGELITIEVPTYVQNLGCITNCPSSSLSWYSFSGGWEYKDQCEANDYGNTLKRYLAKATNIKDYLVEMPTDLIDQQCFTLDVDFSRLYTRVKSSTEGYNDFIIDLTSTSLMYNGGPTITAPFGVLPVTDLGDSIIIRLPSNVAGQSGVIPVDLKADCAGQPGGTQTLKFTNKVSYNGDESCSLFTHECLNNSYQMHCPAPCPKGGATPKFFSLERITYGLPDSNDNGVPDATGTVDLDAINLHRAVNGDTLLGTWNIYVNPNVFDAVENPTDPNIGMPFNYTYVEFDLRDYPLANCSPDNDPDYNTMFTPVPDAEVIVYPVGGGAPITCTVTAVLQDDPDAPATTNTIAKYDLSPCKATWEGGDSIVLRAKYVTNASLNNSGFNLYISDNEVYSSYTANPTGTNPSDENKYTCDKFNDFMNVLRIYHSPYMPNPQDINGCTNDFIAYLRQYVNVQANNVWFPNEYRSFYIQDRYAVVWPPELEYRPGSAKYDGITIPDANIMQVGDSLIFSNLKQFYQPYGGTILPDDETQSHSLIWSVDPTCDADVGAIYRAKFYGENVGNGVNTPTANTVAYRSCDNKFSANISMQYDGPLPFITGGGSVQVSSDTASWQVILNNGSNSLNGPNTWFYVNDVNGTLSDFTITQGGTEITPDANGFFQLGENTAGNSTSYDIEGILIGCGDSEVQVISGFNCSAYPTDINNLSCADTVLLQSTSLPSEVQVSFINQPVVPMMLCVDQNIKLKQTSSQAAFLDNPMMSFIVPDGVIMPATIDVEYPEGSGNIEALTPTIIGSEWTLNFEDHTQIGDDGIPGTIDALTPEERSVVIDFDFGTDCNFLSGDNFVFKGLGIRPCGDVANNNGVRVGTVDLDVQGVTKPYINNFTLDSPTFEGCSATTLSADIQFVGLNATTTSELDSVYIVLEENVEYVPGSFICTNSDPAECLVFSYLTTNSAGDQVVVLSMPAGGLDIDVPLTTSFTYQAKPGIDDLCGSSKNINYSVVTNLGDVPCISEASGFCPSLAVTLGQDDVDVIIEKSLVTFEPGTTFCNEAAGSSYSGSIKVEGLAIETGDSLVLDVYCADATGGAALYTESITLNGPIAIGEVVDFSGILSLTCNAENGVVVQLNKIANATENCICVDQSLLIAGTTMLECTTAINNNVLCFDESTGSATVSGTGGSGSYSFLWDNGDDRQTADTLSAGIHTVIITDAIGCTTTCDVTITEPAVLTCTATQVSPVECNGESNGIANVVPTGGTANYTYLWDNNETTSAAIMLDAGLHTVTVTDANGCTTTCDVTIAEPAALTCTVAVVNNVDCNGESNGSATVTPTGGNGTNTFLWDNGETTATATMLATGVRTVTVTDSEGCTTTCNITITEPAALTCTVSEDTPVVCNGESNGVATVTPVGGTGTITYAWDNGETTATATMLDVGLHTVTITDGNSCTTTCDVTITEPSVFTCTASEDTPVVCNGESNGIATVIPTGGNGTNTFLWDNGETTSTATMLDAGVHTVTVTDANNCTTTCMVTITEPLVLACTTTLLSNVECNGELNGSASVTPTGGTPNYTYAWDNGETTSTATMLDAGVHTVTITDGNNCTTTCDVTVNEPVVLACTVALVSDVMCNGESNGSATVTPTGGNGTNTIAWDNGETTATATMLDAGLHTVTVTDAMNCTTACNITISEPAALTCTVSEDTPVVCNGESNGIATVTPIGGTGTITYAWDNGETTATATMLDAGLHTVTITDGNSCTTTCDVTITEPTVFTCTAAEDTPAVCNGESNGIATVIPTGGNGTNTFLWDNGETTSTATMLDAGVHTVTITDANNCTTTCMVTITEPLVLACTTTLLNNVECNGESNGSASVTPTGGTPNYTILWDNGETTATATMLDAGVHTVTITDGNACTTTCNVTISENGTLACTTVVNANVVCNGESNGSATVTATDGTPNYTYVWDNGETTAIATMLDAGVHSVTVTDDEGCTTTCMATITEPAALTCTVVEDTPVVCNGESNGIATVTPVGGTGTITYAWDNGETTATATMLDAGLHTVTVTDASNCTSTCDVTITEPTLLECAAAEDTPVVCNGESNGIATVTPSGGNGTNTFLWGNGETTATATMLDAGVHTVTVTDINDCTTTCMVTITEPLVLACTTTLLNDVECNGESNGSASVTPTGGTPNYTYAWDKGETTATATMLDAGVHTVTITDGNACTTICDVTVNEPLVLACTAALISDVVCNGESNGSASVTPTGGNGTNTYAWDNGETTATATMLDAGLHTVTVTDAMNCTTTCTVTISEPVALTCTVAQDAPVVCNGEANGIATVTASDGTAGYTYLWDNGETNATAILLDAGSHTVTVTDATNCTTTCTVTITEPDALTCVADEISPVECNGESNGQANVVASGGNGTYTYLWDNGEMTANALLLDAGNHTVTVTDVAGCETTCSVLINEPLVLTCSIGQVVNADCNGASTGQASVTPLGGNGSYTYVWDNGETTATATMLDAGSHTVTVTDAKDCTTTCTVGITEPVALTCTVVEDNPVDCDGEANGGATVTGMGGTGSYSYLWDNGETTQSASMLTGGIHTVQITDANNCTTSCTVTISNPSGVSCSVVEDTPVVCFGEANGVATVTAVGGSGVYTYAWENGETTATATMLTGGIHTVTVSDGNDCATSCIITIAEPDTLTCTVVLDTPVVCNGESNGSVTVTPVGGNGGNTILWDNGETTSTATMLDAGIHTVTITDSKGCTTTCDVNVLEPAVLSCDITKISDVVCNGEENGVATVNATGGNPGYTYLWDNGETTLTAIALDAGVHIVTVTDIENCTTTCTVTINEFEALACTVVEDSPVECNGEDNGVATVTATGGSGGNTYAWDNGETTTTATMLSAGQHTVTVTDNNNCTTTCTVTIANPSGITCMVVQDSPVVCNGESNGSATVTAMGGNGMDMILWDNGETTATATMLDAGMHSVTITDVNGCSTSCTVDITEPELLECTVVEDTPVVCNGEDNGIATVTPTGGNGTNTYLWDNGETTATATMLDAGIHTVTVTDIELCTTTCTVTITEPAVLVCMTNAIASVTCFGDDDGIAEVTESGGNGNYTYLWDNGETTSTATMLTAGVHTVTVTDDLDCETTCDVTITGPEELTCSIIENNPVTCNGDTDGSATVTIVGGNGGNIITWDNGETTAAAIALTGGEHTVTIIDSENCQTTCTVTIGEPEVLTCSIVKENDPLCAGDNGSATVAAFGGNGNFSYLWNNGEITSIATMLPGGMAMVTITDDKNCTTVCSIEMIDQPDCITIDKSFVSTTQTSAYCYDVVYDITVDNFGVVAVEYDLADTTAFDDDIVINSATYTSDAADFFSLALNASGEWTLANNQDIVAGKVDTYTMTVNVCIDLTDGIVGDDTYSACGGTTTNNTILPNEGLYNTASLDLDNDGIPNEQASACGDLPYITHEKQSPTVSTQNADLSYDVTYLVVVENEGGAEGPYDLSDIPAFDDDIVINSGTFTSTNGLTGALATTNGATNVLADDQLIAGESIDIFTVVFNVTLDLADTSTDGGDNTYDECGATNGAGSPSANEGLFNTSTLDLDNDGTQEETSEVCGDLPYVTHEKTGPTVSTLNADLSYDVVYTIAVENVGGAEGVYDLSDIPNFDDDVVINSASFTADNGLSGALGTTIGDANVLADDQTIDAGATDTYTVTFNVTMDLNPGSTDGGDNAYVACSDVSDPLAANIPQAALLNISTIDTNNDGNPEEGSDACGELPFITLEKLDPIVSDRNADGTYDVTYEVAVSNIGGADGPYDLFDTPQFEDDITINSASFTSTNALSGTLAPTNDTENQLADDAILAAGATDTYTVTFNVTLDLSGTGTDAGDNNYDECGAANGGSGPSPFEGLYNTATVDTNNDGTPEQEDDSCGDIFIFDLASKKTVDAGQDIVLGGEVNYTITVYNQGNINAQNVEVIDYLPAGITFAPSNDLTVWTYNSVDSTATGLITDVILPGDSTTISLIGIVGLGPDWTNVTEILSSEDDMGNDTTSDDIDSTPNDDPEDDNGDDTTDDQIDDDGIVDEDDQDPATIDVFDLAFVKTSLTTESVNIGDTVSFEFKVYNQGNAPAYNMVVTDYIADGFEYAQDINLGWDAVGSTAFDTIPGPLAAGDSTSVFLSLIVVNDGTPSPEDWYNEGEISSADNDEDPDNDPPVDFDSTPDSDPNNDNDVTPGDENDDETDENGELGNPGDDEDDNDVSLIEVNGAIGDYVWNDTNADGIQDPDETGIEGVIVNVLDTDGNIVGSDTTDIDGYYFVNNLPPGDYQVQFITDDITTDYDPSPQDEGGDDTVDSDADTDGFTIFTEISSGEVDTTWDAGFYEPASISNFVWLDTNGDGAQDPGEMGIEGIIVNVLDTDGNIVGSDTTDVNGEYLVGDLPPGDYQVQFITDDVVGDYIPSPQDAGGDDTTDSDIDENGLTIFTTLDPGENDPTWDAGFYETGSISNYVWNDTDADGIQDPDESGIEGVIVNVIDSLGNVIGSDTTDINGEYYVGDLPPGDYTVEFITDDITTDYDPSPQDEGDDTTDSDANEDGVTGVITIESGEDDETIDAGFYEPASISNFVWLDTNGDGVQDPDEMGIAGIIVNVLDTDGNIVGSDTTDVNGEYLVDGLPPGDYQVQFITDDVVGDYIPSPQDAGGDDTTDSDIDESGLTIFTTLEPGENDPTWDAGFYETGSISNYVWNDTDADGTQDPDETGIEGVIVNVIDSLGNVVGSDTTVINGEYYVGDLPPGDYTVEFITDDLTEEYDPSPQDEGDDTTDSDANEDGVTGVITLDSGEDDETIDAGFYEPASISNFVWEDTNGDGIQDDGELGIEGVIVNVLDTDGNIVGSDTTDVNGEYYVSNLPPGDYQVQFITDDVVGDYIPSPQDEGGDDATDSDVDADGFTIFTTLEPGENDDTWDAGFYETGSISNYVWEDTDADGVQDPDETGIEGIIVNVLDLDGNIVGSDTTDVNGEYYVGDLPPGDYTVEFITDDVVGDYIPSPQDEGDDTTDSDINVDSVTGVVTIDSGEDDETVDAGLYIPAAIGNYVWLDEDADGLQGDSESGIEGIVVTLLYPDGTPVDTNAFGDPITTQITDGDGFYEFVDLVPGDYIVQFGETDEYTYTIADAGDDATDSDPDPTTGNSPIVSLESGEIDNTIDAGFIYTTVNIGDYVWHDIDGDGIQDSNEPGIGEVMVMLYNDDNDLVAITTTDANGNYLFEDVFPGSYYIVFIDPDGYTSTFPNTTDDNNDSDITNFIFNAGGSTTDLFDAIPNMDDYSFDAGFYKCIQIGELVWYDTDEDDLWDSFENGINGLTVNLYRLVNGSYQLYETQTTGHKPGTPSDDGYFKFCAPPGTYYVEVEMPPIGLVQGVANQVNSLPLGNANEPINDSDLTNNFGQATTASFSVLSGDMICTIGGGFYPMATVGNLIWNDSNENGLQDQNESKVSGVLVEAFELDGTKVGESESNELGVYEIDYLGKNDYYLRFTPPSGYGFTAPDSGVDSLDSDVTHQYGIYTTNKISMMPGMKIESIDAGIKFGVLPLEWLTISALWNGEYATVKWSTGYELNNDYFDIERRHETESDFTKVGEVDSKGDSNTEVRYSYDDKDTFQEGKYYYRIKQTDLDGSFDYSPIVFIDISRNRNEVKLYPNPTADVSTLSIVLPEVNEIEVSIFDAIGQLVRVIPLSDSSVNGINTEVQIGDLPKGVYMIHIENGTFNELKQLIVLK